MRSRPTSATLLVLPHATSFSRPPATWFYPRFLLLNTAAYVQLRYVGIGAAAATAPQGPAGKACLAIAMLSLALLLPPIGLHCCRSKEPRLRGHFAILCAPTALVLAGCLKQGWVATALIMPLAVLGVFLYIVMARRVMVGVE